MTTTARCRFCDQPISWIYCPEEGTSVPVDEDPVFVDLSTGNVRFITDEGVYITGRMADQENPPSRMDVAYLLHGCWTNRRMQYIKN